MPGGPKEQRRAQVGLAAIFVVLALILQFFLVSPFLWYGGRLLVRWGEDGVWYYAVPQAILLSGVLFSCFEGARGLRQRRVGATIVVVLSVLWLLVFGFVLFGRIVGEA